MFLFWTQQYIHMLCPSEKRLTHQFIDKKILEENKLTFLGNVLPQVAVLTP